MQTQVQSPKAGDRCMVGGRQMVFVPAGKGAPAHWEFVTPPKKTAAQKREDAFARKLEMMGVSL